MPSFFFTTAERKPRTECACQPVACMSTSIVAPFGAFSFFKTMDDFVAVDCAIAFAFDRILPAVADLHGSPEPGVIRLPWPAPPFLRGAFAVASAIVAVSWVVVSVVSAIVLSIGCRRRTFRRL